MKLFATVSLPLLTIDVQSFQKSIFKAVRLPKEQDLSFIHFSRQSFLRNEAKKKRVRLNTIFFKFKFGG